MVLILDACEAPMTTKPDPSKLRIWTNRSGSCNVQAQFLGMEDKILLLKLGGIKIRVPREKLSFQDLAYVEDIIDTKLDSEDNTDSDSMRAEKIMPDAGTPLHTALSARVISQGSSTQRDGWFIIQALLEDGQTWELTRYDEDFYDLHKGVLAEFPIELRPGLLLDFTNFDGAREIKRLPEIKAYLKDLLGRLPHISTCVSVERFFAPRDGDFEIDPVDWRESSTDEFYYPRPSIGSD
ncbi:hypothetical protein INS49_012122 [Diaporthe citri]|uniref:uncharacterized protein n=1 Tax=Diaporthe citri TaxID=83186 RepID=UPI001C7FC56C|nr:uncharacterized protein INS49_012122 [Diaporthe citri]KAG6358604.1 hypothetical protein INS49_012122 [Diaporthe citri]